MTTPRILPWGPSTASPPGGSGRWARPTSPRRWTTTTSARRICPGTGIQYDWNADVTVGLAYEYLDAGDAGIDQEGGPLQGDLKGDYETNAIHFMAVNVILRF